MLLKKHFLCFISCVYHLLYRQSLCRIHEVTDKGYDEQIRTYSYRWECTWFKHGLRLQVWMKLIINSWITRKTDLDHCVRSKFMIQLSLAVWRNFTCSVWTKWLSWPACKWPHSCVHALRKRLGLATTVCFLEAVWSSVIAKADELGHVVTTSHGSQWVARLSFSFVPNDFTLMCCVRIKQGFGTKST